MRTILRLVVLATIAVLVVSGGLAFERQRCAAKPPSAQALHTLATTTPEGTFAVYPKVHQVVCPDCPQSTWQVLIDATKKGAGPQGAGNYDPKTGKIRIVAEEVRWEASLPEGMRPNFDHLLRHEYGHAFLDDWVKGAAPKDASGKQLAYLPYTEGTNDTGSYPKAMRPVLDEYRRVKPDVYGLTYYTSEFGEYMAESYARFCEGQYVSKATAAFLRSQLSPN
jgi:hypothetical protein